MEAHLINSFDFVEIGNRTKAPLTVTYDGKQWVLPPFPATVHMPRIVADVACRQHPRMGTENPYNPREYELLVYVKGWNQTETAVEQSGVVERIDRSQLPADRQKTELRDMRTKTQRGNFDVGIGEDAVFQGGVGVGT